MGCGFRQTKLNELGVVFGPVLTLALALPPVQLSTPERSFIWLSSSLNVIQRPCNSAMETKKLRLAIVILTALTPLYAQTPAPTVTWVAVRAARLLSRKSDGLLTDQPVLIKDDKISEVGPADRVQIPAGAEVLDLSHATVLPGLIDAHTHVFGNGPDLETQILRDSWQYRTLTALANAQKDMMVGFTTLRDLKTLGAMYSDVDLRNAIDRGVVQGPRMQVATRGIQTTGGFIMRGYSSEVPVPTALEVVDSPWAARQAVREQVAHGADLIKLYAAYDFTFDANGKMVIPPTFTLEEVQAIVDEAHGKGRKVSCHAFGGEGLHHCLDAGVDSIEHGVVLDDSAIKKMLDKGIYLVPTLYHYQLDKEHDQKRFAGHSVAEVSEPSFSKAVARGVKIAFGSGAGPFPHGSQTKEFEYMVKFGMTPAQAIRAATSVASELMGWQDRVGTLEVGKFADLVVNTKFSEIPGDVVELGKKSILDGLGLALSGSRAETANLIQNYAKSFGFMNRGATVIGSSGKLPSRFAAFANGVAIHVDDFDDTQLAAAKDRVYGLLVHPTVCVLPAVLAIADTGTGEIGGEDLMLS